MTINISDMLVTIVQPSKQSWGIVAIGAVATLVSGFGGVYLASILNEKRKEKEENRQNIEKVILLHSLVEEYLTRIIDYKKNCIEPKNKAFADNNLTEATFKNPYTSYLFPLKITDFPFLLTINNSLWSVLNQALNYAESFDSIILEIDKFLSSNSNYIQITNLDIFKKKYERMLYTLTITNDDAIFFFLLLYKNLNILIHNYYKRQHTVSDKLSKMSLEELAKDDKNKMGWIKGLENSWEIE